MIVTEAAVVMKLDFLKWINVTHKMLLLQVKQQVHLFQQLRVAYLLVNINRMMVFVLQPGVINVQELF